MYDLHNLGWYSFQQLCLTIAREVLGQTVQSYLDSNDGGRDGAFTGEWNPTGQENLSGRFVFQCKFTTKPGQPLRPSDLSDEVDKVKTLVKLGLCNSYVLMTNAGLSGKQAEKIEALFLGAGVKHIVILGATWIGQQIRENKRLRMLVPRVYGLGDLSQILDERAYAQARAILDSLREDLAKVVITDAYVKAATALNKHGFVLLIGEPAAGKTTIASLLAMAAVDQWGTSLLKLDKPDKVVEHWNPEDPSQFFWLDDAFGVTQFDAFLARGWNHIFPQVKTMLRNGAKIVMTSRDYIYNRARLDLKEGAFPLLNESQVVIDVHALAMEEKQQILYNHLKLGNQNRAFRVGVKPHLEFIAAHPRFIPETARRLADPFFTEGLRLDQRHIGEFVEKLDCFLQEVLQGLDCHGKAALALIYMRKDRLESPICLQPSEIKALERLGSTLGDCVTALDALKGSLVLHSHSSGDFVWRFKHPTIGDAYAAILTRSPELLGIFVQGSAPDKLIEQVTCGDVGMEKAVIIPRTLFPLVIDSLAELLANKKYRSGFPPEWRSNLSVQRFLTHRCSKEFLSLYLVTNPELLDRVSKPGLYLYAVPEVDLAVRLHELGLLPENKRKEFVATVSEYAVNGEDVDGLGHPGIRRLFKTHEFTDLLESVRTQLFPRLGDVRWEMQSNHHSDESPEAHMQPLLEMFHVLNKYFGEDADIAKIIEREARSAHEWISEHVPEEPAKKPRTLGTAKMPNNPPGARSIFDDIDA
jgi:energy-coupling factor transporter ATP-binding protein EcfA2